MSEGDPNENEVEVNIEPLLRPQCYKNEYSIETQIAYLLQWFGEFSGLEKDDFLQELLHLDAPGQLSDSLRGPQMTNEAKLPTLFDCRMDLLRKWFGAWNEEDRAEFMNQLNAADSNFFKKFEMSKTSPISSKS